MQWQADGDLARGDWLALVDRLKAVESEHHAPELQRLSKPQKSTD